MNETGNHPVSAPVAGSKPGVREDHLTVQDVVDMTGSGKSLTILGDSGDSVSLKGTVGGTWSTGGSQTVDGHNFDVYLNTQDSTVRVLIEQQINKRFNP